jgi:hypothetical protein
MFEEKVKKYLVRNKSKGIVVKKRHQAKGINCRGVFLKHTIVFQCVKGSRIATEN